MKRSSFLKAAETAARQAVEGFEAYVRETYTRPSSPPMPAAVLSHLEALRSIELAATAEWAGLASVAEVRVRLDELFHDLNGFADPQWRSRSGGMRQVLDFATEKLKETEPGLVGKVLDAARSVALGSSATSTSTNWQARAMGVEVVLETHAVEHAETLARQVIYSRGDWNPDEEYERFLSREMKAWDNARPVHELSGFFFESASDRIHNGLESGYKPMLASAVRAAATATNNPQRFYKAMADLEEQLYREGRRDVEKYFEDNWGTGFGINRRTKTALPWHRVLGVLNPMVSTYTGGSQPWTPDPIDNALSDVLDDHALAEALRMASTVSVEKLKGNVPVGMPGHGVVSQAYLLLEKKGYIKDGKYVIPEKLDFKSGAAEWVKPHWTDETLSTEGIMHLLAAAELSAATGGAATGYALGTVSKLLINAGVMTLTNRALSGPGAFSGVPSQRTTADDFFKEYLINLVTFGVMEGMGSAFSKVGSKVVSADALASSVGKSLWGWSAQSMTSVERAAALKTLALSVTARGTEAVAMAGFDRLMDTLQSRESLPFWELVVKQAVVMGIMHSAQTSSRPAGSPPTEAYWRRGRDGRWERVEPPAMPGQMAGAILERARHESGGQQYGPPRPGPDFFQHIKNVREAAGKAYEQAVDLVINNAKYRRAIEELRAHLTDAPEPYRRALEDLLHGAAGHGPIHFAGTLERLWRDAPDLQYRRALENLRDAVATDRRRVELDDHDRAQLDAKTEDIRKAAGKVNVEEEFERLKDRVGEAGPPRWREELSDTSRRRDLVDKLKATLPDGTADVDARRKAAIEFLYKAGSWQKIKGAVSAEFPDVADLLFNVRGELADAMTKKYDATLIGTVKSMVNDADYNFKLVFGEGDRANNPIENMRNAAREMQRIVDRALGSQAKGNWELIWESNFYLDPKILHLHTTLPDAHDQAVAWRHLSRDSAGLFLEILDRLHVPRAEADRYRELFQRTVAGTEGLPTMESLARELGLREWSGREGRDTILRELKLALDAYFGPNGKTLENALRAVQLNMLLNVESEGAYVPPGAGWLTVTLKEGTGIESMRPFKDQLKHLKIPEEVAKELRDKLQALDQLRTDQKEYRRLQAELDGMRRAGTDAAILKPLMDRIEYLRNADPSDARIGELEQAIQKKQEELVTKEVARRQAEVDKLPQGPERDALQRVIGLMLTPGGLLGYIDYLRLEVDVARVREIAKAGDRFPDIPLQSVLGDIQFYFHILQGAQYESFWGVQRYELFKYASRVTEVAQAMGLGGETEFLQLTYYKNKAAQIYEDHTPAEQFPGDPFSRAEDMVKFERNLRSLQFKIVEALLKRTTLGTTDPTATRLFRPVDFPAEIAVLFDREPGGPEQPVRLPRETRALLDPRDLGVAEVRALGAEGRARVAAEQDFADLIDGMEVNRRALLDAREAGIDADALARQHGFSLGPEATELLAGLSEPAREALAAAFEEAAADALDMRLDERNLVQVHVFVNHPTTGRRVLNPDYELILRSALRGKEVAANPLMADEAYTELLGRLRERFRSEDFVANVERGVIVETELGEGGVGHVTLVPLLDAAERALLREMIRPPEERSPASEGGRSAGDGIGPGALREPSSETVVLPKIKFEDGRNPGATADVAAPSPNRGTGEQQQTGPAAPQPDSAAALAQPEPVSAAPLSPELAVWLRPEMQPGSLEQTIELYRLVVDEEASGTEEAKRQIDAAKREGVTGIDDLIAGFDPDGPTRSHEMLAPLILEARLRHAGYDLEMPVGDFQRIQSAYVQSRTVEGIRPEELAWLHRQVAARADFFESLPKRGRFLKYEPRMKGLEGGFFMPSEGFLAALDPESARELRDAYEKATFSREPAPTSGEEHFVALPQGLDLEAWNQYEAPDKAAILAGVPHGEVDRVYAEMRRKIGELETAFPGGGFVEWRGKMADAYAFYAGFELAALRFEASHPDAVLVRDHAQGGAIDQVTFNALMLLNGQPSKAVFWSEEQVRLLRALAPEEHLGDLWYAQAPVVIPDPTHPNPLHLEWEIIQMINPREAEAIRKAAERNDLTIVAPRSPADRGGQGGGAA
jgi:hypothetical protein